jgi:two-component system, chemotaxis family, chemotaxis protein CheY
MRSLSIMIVDDSILTINKIQKIVEEAGHSVVKVCDSGKQAVEAYPIFLPDIITMDITMPDMNGIDATKAIIANYPDALIVVITSHGQEQMVVEAVDAGAKGYILKPINQESLCRTLEQIYDRYGNIKND